MSRLSRSQLKGLVKECLLEILSEGIGESESQMISESTRPRRQRSSRESSSRRSALDHVSFGSKPRENPRFNERVENNVKSLTQDPVMQAIFSDTAKTTLQEQLAAGGPNDRSHANVMTQGDDAARAMASSDPTDLFSGASQNWAALAFGDASSQK